MRPRPRHQWKISQLLSIKEAKAVHCASSGKIPAQPWTSYRCDELQLLYVAGGFMAPLHLCPVESNVFLAAHSYIFANQIFNRAIPRSTKSTAAMTMAAESNTLNETCSAANHQPNSTAIIGLT